MKYMTAAQASEKWGITVRRVQELCRNDQIDGTVRWGRDWMIPEEARKPADRRKKRPEAPAPKGSYLPRKNPALVFSSLYHRPGTADEVARSLESYPRAAALFRADLAYLRGDVDRCWRLAGEVLKEPCDHDVQIGCGIVMSIGALYLGNNVLWNQAKQIIATAPCHNNRERMAVDFWLAAAASELRETTSFPPWFMRGRFDMLPQDSFPCARFYYLRYLYLMGQEYAMGHRSEQIGQRDMRFFPYVAEPLIAENRKEGALVSELYARLICACAYHDLGNDAMASYHLDLAIALALPDKLYMPLAEYRRQMDFLMDERLQKADEDALQEVRRLNRVWLEGWTQMQSLERGKQISNTLTPREREVAKLAAFGLTNKEIAQRRHISVNTVKQSLRAAMNKTGALQRSELSHYI